MSTSTSLVNSVKQADKFFELSSLPNAKLLLLKAATTASRKVNGETIVPQVAVRVPKVTFNPVWVREYNKVCGFDGTRISLTAPQVLASSLHMYLLTRPMMPVPLLGMVHLRNSIELYKALDYGYGYEVVVRVGETRRVPQGIEFDLITEFMDEGEKAWSAVTTILSRVAGPRAVVAKQAAAAPVPLSAVDSQYFALSVPTNQGRKYAKVSSDYNPIHLYAQTAKLFGFPKAIAHGMWTAAKILSLLEPKIGPLATRFDVKFKQPVLLPSKSTLKFQVQDGAAQFELLGARDSKALIEGSIIGTPVAV